MKKTPNEYLEKWAGKTIKAVVGKSEGCILIVVEKNRRITHLPEGREILAAICAKSANGEITI